MIFFIDVVYMHNTVNPASKSLREKYNGKGMANCRLNEA